MLPSLPLKEVVAQVITDYKDVDTEVYDYDEVTKPSGSQPQPKPDPAEFGFNSEDNIPQENPDQSSPTDDYHTSESDDHPKRMRPHAPSRRKGESKDSFQKRYKAYKKDLKQWEKEQGLGDSPDDTEEEVKEPKGKGKKKDSSRSPSPTTTGKSDKNSGSSDQTDEVNDSPTSQDDLDPSILDQLLQRSVDDIKAFRKKPSNYKSSRHLIRFGDNKGNPTPINKDEVRDDDIVVSLFDGIHSVRYVLTFGGEDRRPIFNRIIDHDWTAFS